MTGVTLQLYSQNDPLSARETRPPQAISALPRRDLPSLPNDSPAAAYHFDRERVGWAVSPVRARERQPSTFSTRAASNSSTLLGVDDVDGSGVL